MIVIGHDEELRQWVSLQIGETIGKKGDPAIGFVMNGKLTAAAVYHNYVKDENNESLAIDISFAAIHPRWCTKGNIAIILGYPFDQLHVRRLGCMVNKKNKRVRKLLEGVGFRLEGVARFLARDGGDMCSYSMTRHEYGKRPIS